MHFGFMLLKVFLFDEMANIKDVNWKLSKVNFKNCEQYLDSAMGIPTGHWTSAIFYSVATTTQQKWSFATENQYITLEIPH